MTTETDIFQLGDRVVVTGLHTASHMNGRHGTVGALLGAVNGRIGVDLDLDPTQKRVNAKQDNLLKENPIPKEVESNRAPAERGILKELYHGRTASFLLDAIRYIAAVQFLSEPGVKEFGDIEQIRAQGQRGLLRINHFHATAWSNWLDDDGEVEHRQRGVFNHLRKFVQEELLRNAELTHASEALDHITCTAGWHIRIHGDFWVVGHDEEGGTGTYLVPTGNHHMTYKILGVRNALFPMLQQHFGETPVCMTMTLIPWYGRLLYDGVVAPKIRSGSPMQASESLARQLKGAVQSAVEEGRVVERMAELEVPGGTRRSTSASANISGGTSSNGSQSSQSPPTEEENKFVEQIMTFRSLSVQDKQGYWIYRRTGYDEVENPKNMGSVLVGDGSIMGPFQCMALQPTAVDILEDLVQKCNSGIPPIPANCRPWSIGIDDKACCQRLRFLFRDHTSLSIEYYRPPSKEEENSAKWLGPG